MEVPRATAGRESGQGPLTFASLTAGAPLLNGQRTVPGQHGALLSLASHLFVLDKKRQGTCGINLTRNPNPQLQLPLPTLPSIWQENSEIVDGIFLPLEQKRPPGIPDFSEVA